MSSTTEIECNKRKEEGREREKGDDGDDDADGKHFLHRLANKRGSCKCGFSNDKSSIRKIVASH